MRALPMIIGLAVVGLAIGARAPATASPAAPDGSAIFRRCAACHLSTGAGVPGAYPPLGSNVRGFAQSTAGRNYMAMVVMKGVTGPVTVDGRTYRGVMPAQGGLDDAAIAAVLNHVVTNVAKGNGRAFTVAEIAAARSTSSTLNAVAVGKLRPGAAGK